MSNIRKIVDVTRCTYDQAKEALNACKGDINASIDFIYQRRCEDRSENIEDPLMLNAMKESLLLQIRSPLGSKSEAEKEMRQEGTPVGLKSKDKSKNSFLNCLLQTYFAVPHFTELVMRSAHSSEFSLEIKKLFGNLIHSHRKSVDPSTFLSTVELINPDQLENFNSQLAGHIDDLGFFYGDLSEVRGEEVSTRKFGNIPLAPQFNTLDEAWDSAFNSSETELWIDSAPKILIFCVRGESLNYTHTVSPGRFMKELSEKSQFFRKKSNEIRAKIRLTEEEIYSISHYDGLGISLEEILKHCRAFIETDGKKMNLENIQPMLEHYISMVGEERRDNETILDNLKLELEDLYAQPEFNENLYMLHSVIEENYEGYLAHIKHLEGWWTYDNEEVFETTESAVLNKTNNLILFYISEHLARTNSYEGLVNDRLLADIDHENEVLKNQVSENQLSSDAYTVAEAYKSKYELVNFQIKSPHSMPWSSLINFTMFLRTKNQFNLFSWHLMDTCLREIGKTLDETDQDDPLLLRINTQLCEYTLQWTLFPTESSKLKKLQEEYSIDHKLASILEYMFKNIRHGNIHEVAHAIYHQIKVNMPDSDFYKVFAEILGAFLLLLSAEIKKMAYSGDLQRALGWCEYIADVVSVFNFRSRVFQRTINDRVVNFMNTLPTRYRESFDPAMNEVIKAIQKRLKKKQSSLQTNCLGESPPELLGIIKEFESHDYYGWADGWEPNSTAKRYAEADEDLRKHWFWDWIDLVRKIHKNTLNPKDLIEAERKLGVK